MQAHETEADNYSNTRDKHCFCSDLYYSLSRLWMHPWQASVWPRTAWPQCLYKLMVTMLLLWLESQNHRQKASDDSLKEEAEWLAATSANADSIMKSTKAWMYFVSLFWRNVSFTILFMFFCECWKWLLLLQLLSNYFHNSSINLTSHKTPKNWTTRVRKETGKRSRKMKM